jgi:transcription elongation factor Elf1
VPTAQQFICQKCTTLSQVQTFEQHHDGAHFARCQQCGAKNQIVLTGASPSQPGLLPVIRLLD